MSERDRIRHIVEKWFLCEPLLFGAYTTHALVIEPRIATIRVRDGRIEYNPAFISNLNPRQLESVLQFETLRILLKHPYQRHQENAELTYAASNITLQEYLYTDLPFPTAKKIFGTDEFNRQYLEFYYAKLQELHEINADSDGCVGAAGRMARFSIEASEGDIPIPATLEAYADAAQTGKENAEYWSPDDFLMDRIDEVIHSAEENRAWGSITGGMRERILATLRPRLDYRTILRQFRTSILSSQRILTRMKPNRRYGFDYLGSRRDFVTRLLVAVDVSGSMTSKELEHGFSLINQFFKYGIPCIEVIQFDTEIKGKTMTLKSARHEIQIIGRGGTSFTPLMEFLGAHNEYDGMIIFTDGYADIPPPPKNRYTRILWIFNHETNYRANYPSLKHLGKGAFIRSDALV